MAWSMKKKLKMVVLGQVANEAPREYAMEVQVRGRAGAGVINEK